MCSGRVLRCIWLHPCVAWLLSGIGAVLRLPLGRGWVCASTRVPGLT
jgi:hypothetical protein